MKHKSVLIGLAFAALSSAAFGQLIITDQPTSPTVSALQADGAILLGYAENSQPSFTFEGLEFSLVPNYFLGDIVVGNGVDGEFFANVTFMARESLRPNHFGVSDASLGGFGTGGITLFLDYNAAHLGVTKHITAATYTELNFWHYADKPGYEGTYYMDDALSFRTWEAIDIDNNRIITYYGIDDLRTSVIDFNDGVIRVERNLLPIAFENPVPEPSTFALFGAVGLMFGVIARRIRQSRKASPFVAAN